MWGGVAMATVRFPTTHNYVVMATPPQILIGQIKWKSWQRCDAFHYRKPSMSVTLLSLDY